MASQMFDDFRHRLVGEFPQTPFYKEKKNFGGTIIKEKIKTKRTRPYAYSFRVSESEKNLLDEKVKLSGLNRTDFLIKTLSDKKIVSIQNGNEILAELKRQGNNLNQAIKNFYFGYNTEKVLLSSVAECKKIYANLQKAIGGT